MEDQVPFKVFTFWGENEKPEVRRFGIDKGVVTSFQYLKSKLEDIFPALKDKIYTVNWKDEEEDEVTVSSDDELMMALIAMRSQDLAKLYVRIKDPEPADDERDIVITLANAPIKHSSTHFGVVCDGCESPVVGFRYKCTSCEDYDLCGKCENAGLHPEHCMVRIPMPTMPYQALKAAIKRSRHILKTVANNVEECPYKKNRRDRSCEKKHGGDHGHGGHGDHRRDRHHRRRSGWLDTFATYMNEFANLAGDVGLDAESGPDSSKTSETNAQKKAENTQGEQPNASAKNATANENPRESFGPCPFMPNNVSFEVIQNILGQYMNGNLDLKAFLPQPENEPKEAPQASTSGQSADASVNTKTDTNNAAVNTNDVEMPQAEQQASESIKSETTSQSSASSVRDESPDKGDDWTVINKEKDLMDGYMKSSDQSELGAPIGFNLPAEFQERVKISEGQNLYPPLNAATAVFNPQVVERPVLPPPIQPQQAPVQRPAATAPPQPKPQQQPPQPQPQPPKPQPPPPQQQQRPPQPPQQQRPPQPQPQQRPQQQRPQQPLQQPHWLRHPNPRIDASLQQMLAMGFTNDGGWLTSLLENKDGNIAAVLDLLTPVNSRN